MKTLTILLSLLLLSCKSQPRPEAAANTQALNAGCKATGGPYESCEAWLKLGCKDSGVYLLDVDGVGEMKPIKASCDMATDGGGWTLVLGYLHGINSQPVNANVMKDRLPILGSSQLGRNESLNPETWGHASNTMLKQMDFQELRFFCLSSSHKRVIHFKASTTKCNDYLRTGLGHCMSLKSYAQALPGHSGELPGDMDSALENGGDNAMTAGTFGNKKGQLWGIGMQNDQWACDDESATKTLHRVWVR